MSGLTQSELALVDPDLLVDDDDSAADTSECRSS